MHVLHGGEFLGTYWNALEVELDLDQLCRFSVQNRHYITGLFKFSIKIIKKIVLVVKFTTNTIFLIILIEKLAYISLVSHL